MDTCPLSFQALLLGTLQGLTEFLPISSSAHLILIPWFFHWNNPLVDSLTFDVALHAGTLLAILWYFRKDWVEMIAGFFRVLVRRRMEKFQEKLVIYIILSTIPAAIAGVLLEKTIESTFRNPGLIVFPLIIVSLLMIFAENYSRRIHPLPKLTLKDSLIIGFAQALALLPGVSRSGITITAGLLRGYEREAATRFSFLLSTPAIAGATVLHLGHLPRVVAAEWEIFAIGFASSGIIGYLAIAFLMRYLRQHTLNVFAGYRLILAAVVIFWIFWKG
ncbi:MAG: undecaprenyl-diphosphatase UppP [Deltaproteobacteria bacterium RBG_19FT_COMBO_52_11]|jgi:undecaprenyl-diphosphatase|nr:MAG: undecaprenyl-diphosphatase UppP [Deltaproteobacteria bacterium RBG_13_49_15]OGP98820.1 MAG: undecaprenyl-diphosphatase UppP [Deltaproteobacteria bacterium RBG_19FT_COMBO_52_11]